MKIKIKKFFDNGLNAFIFMMIGLLGAFPCFWLWGTAGAQICQIITIFFSIFWAMWLHRKNGFFTLFRN